MTGWLRNGSRTAFLGLGAVSFALIHVVFAVTQGLITWGLKSGIFFTHSCAQMAVTAASLGLIAVWALSSFRPHRSARIEAGLWMFAGTLIAMVAVLFLTGPGNLWPIVIVFGAISLAPAFALAILISLSIGRSATAGDALASENPETALQTGQDGSSESRGIDR